MSRFDVYSVRSTGGIAVDVQADLLEHLGTRLVIPLLGMPEADWSMPRLTPTIWFDGKAWILGTPFMIGVPVRELTGPIGSVSDQEYPIALAIDLMLAGV